MRAQQHDLGQFFAVLTILEDIARHRDQPLAWSDPDRAEAMRRLNRLIRAVRFKPPDERLLRRRY